MYFRKVLECHGLFHCQNHEAYCKLAALLLRVVVLWTVDLFASPSCSRIQIEEAFSSSHSLMLLKVRSCARFWIELYREMQRCEKATSLHVW